MQWAGLGMWVALTLSACTPTKREVGNLNVIPQPQEVNTLVPIPKNKR